MDSTSAGAPQKVPLYSVNDLKNATDDALAPYLTSLPAPYTFTQSHYYTNIRLAVGYSAVVIAAATFYADWKLGWDVTKGYTAAACLVYFALNTFLTYWIWKVEAGKVFTGIRQGGQQLTLQSSAQKHKPVYKLKFRYEAPSGKKWEDKEIEGRFTQWFNADGFLQAKELRRWLAQNIEVVGMADPASKMVGSEVEAVKESAADLVVDTPAQVASISDGTKSVKSRKGKKKA